MGLFGGSDDDGTDDGGTGDGGATGTLAERAGDRAREILQAQAGVERRQGLSDLATDVAGQSPTPVAGPALAHAVRDGPDATADVAEELIATVAERELTRPVAESLLRSAADPTWSHVDGDTVVDASVAALDVGLEQLAELRSDGTVPGAGATEARVASAVRGHADTVGGREQLVAEAAASAMEAVPVALARRAGLDPVDALVDLRVAADRGELAGIDGEAGVVRREEVPSTAVGTVTARLGGGLALAGLVIETEGTATQLESLVGYDPFPA